MTYPTKKLGEILEKVPKMVGILTKDYLNEGKYPIVDQGQSRIAGYTNDSSSIYKGDLPVVIFGDHTRSLKFIDFPFAVGADGTKILKPISEIDAKYLYYFLLSIELPARGYARHFSLLKEYEIPVPPIAEQRKIVERIEKQFAKIDEAAHLRAESEALVEKLFPAALHEIFSSAESKGWDAKTVEEVTELVTKGTTPKTYGHAFTTSGIPFLKAENINGIVRAESTHTFISKETHDFLARSKTKSGDVLMTIAGTIGRVGWIPVEEQEMNMNQAVAIIRPKQSLISTEYLACVLSSASSQEQVGTGTVKMAIPNFSLGMIKKIKIPLPSLAEQKKIVKKLDALAAKACMLRDLQFSQSAALKSLKQSILHEAFSNA